MEPLRITSRELAILTALHQHRYLDRDQLAQLFFTGRRRTQLKLLQLRSQGLVTGWRCLVQPGAVQGPAVYALSAAGARLLAHATHVDPRPLVERARHARERAFHVLHDLEANSFFVALGSAARERSDVGLYHWLGEAACRESRAAEGAPPSDGWGRLLLPDRELFFDLEWDRGTEHARRVRQKASAYIRYFRGAGDADRHHVLFVAPTDRREAELRQVIAPLMPRSAACCRFWTTTVAFITSEGPLGRIWMEIGSSKPGLVAFDEMPGFPRSDRRVDDCIGKSSWWERRPGGGEGA